jgi:hypothetical protein
MYKNLIQRKIHSRSGFHEDCVGKELQFVLRSAQNVNNTAWAEWNLRLKWLLDNFPRQFDVPDSCVSVF